MGNPKRGPVVGVSRWRNRGEHIGTARQGGKRTMGTTARHGGDPATAARIAGERGVSATPMSPGQRVDAYWAANGRTRLTPKQSRRIEKKYRRNGHLAPRATGTEAGVSL
jgi:DNA-binding IclR family transcriptional regulator